MAKKAKTYGTFVMDGVRRTAHSPADRVQMVYDGWTEMKTLDAAVAAAEAASAAAAGGSASSAADSGADSGDDSAKVKGPARQQSADSKTTSR